MNFLDDVFFFKSIKNAFRKEFHQNEYRKNEHYRKAMFSESEVELPDRKSSKMGFVVGGMTKIGVNSGEFQIKLQRAV